MTEVSRSNVADTLRDTARRSPEGIALRFHDARVTWGELDRHADAVAAALRGWGATPGEVALVALPNRRTFVAAVYGALRAGLIVAPTNPAASGGDFASLIQSLRPRVVVVDNVALPAVREGVAAAGGAGLAPRIVETDPATASGPCLPTLPAGPVEQVRSASGGEDTAVLLATSGASRRSRLARLSHRAIISNQAATSTDGGLGADDVVLCAMPLFHSFGFNAVLGPAVAVGATVVITDRRDDPDMLGVVAHEGVTYLPVAPAMLVDWLRRTDLVERLATVRRVISGSATLPLSVLGEFMSATGLTVHQGYGVTEAGPVIATTMHSTTVKPGCVGRPVPGVEIRLVDEAGAEVDDEDTGQVLVRSAGLFSGYWHDPADGPDADGWWPTGDIGFIDAEGDLWLVDRTRDRLVVSGFKVYPREVEDVLARHPDIAEVAVVPVPHPYTGQAVKAVVVPREGSGLTVADVTTFALTHLARFKRPTVVELVPELPRTATGGVARTALRGRHAEASSQV